MSHQGFERYSGTIIFFIFSLNNGVESRSHISYASPSLSTSCFCRKWVSWSPCWTNVSQNRSFTIFQGQQFTWASCKQPNCKQLKCKQSTASGLGQPHNGLLSVDFWPVLYFLWEHIRLFVFALTHRLRLILLLQCSYQQLAMTECLFLPPELIWVLPKTSLYTVRHGPETGFHGPWIAVKH